MLRKQLKKNSGWNIQINMRIDFNLLYQVFSKKNFTLRNWFEWLTAAHDMMTVSCCTLTFTAVNSRQKYTFEFWNMSLQFEVASLHSEFTVDINSSYVWNIIFLIFWSNFYFGIFEIFYRLFSYQKQGEAVKPQQRQVLFGIWDNHFGVDSLRADSNLRILRYSSVMGKVTATSFDWSTGSLLHSEPEEISSEVSPNFFDLFLIPDWIITHRQFYAEIRFDQSQNHYNRASLCKKFNNYIEFVLIFLRNFVA